MSLSPADERRHPPGREPGWEEAWYFDFVQAGASGTVGGYVRLALHPATGRVWYWAVVAGDRRPLVAVRDHDVAPPSGRGLEVRGSGLWSDLVCETPLDHWTVGLEAFGVAYDDPLDAWGDERGDHVGLGFDLEWDGVAACHPGPDGAGYQQACAVSGDVLVGPERFSIDGFGIRSHAWGPRVWSGSHRCWAGGRLDDGTAVAGTVQGQVTTEVDAQGLPRGDTFEVGDLALAATPLAHSPVLIPEGPARLARALCRYQAGDGRSGHGWAEWLNPGGSAPGPGPQQGGGNG